MARPRSNSVSFYNDFVLECEKVGHKFNSDEFVFALLKSIEFNNADAMSIVKKIPNDEETLQKKKVSMAQTASLNNAKGQVKYLIGLWDNFFEKKTKRYIEDNKLIEQRINSIEKEQSQDKKTIKEISKMSVNLDTLNEMAIMVFKELKRRDISEFDTREFKDIMEILAKCTKQLDTSDPVQDRIDRSIVEVMKPLNGYCEECRRETYIIPGAVVRCMNCNSWLDHRDKDKRGAEIEIIELPEEYHNYWARNYKEYLADDKIEEED